MERDLEYGSDVIVGVKHHGHWQWYVTEKEYWFLDDRKFAAAFRARGYDVPDENPDRFGIPVVDETTAAEFLRYLADHKISSEDLRSLLCTHLPADSREDILEYQPSLLVDFDARVLKSLYPEPSSFEDFVPDGWKGEHADFLEDVPAAERYWMLNGRDLLEDPSTGCDD